MGGRIVLPKGGISLDVTVLQKYKLFSKYLRNFVFFFFFVSPRKRLLLIMFEIVRSTYTPDTRDRRRAYQPFTIV